MPLVEKSVLVPYSTAQMYALVEDIERYPEFLPWCGGARIERESERVVEATLVIRYGGVRQSFTTRNTSVAGQRIEMALKDGPFEQLEGTWRFTRLRADACKVELELAYRFAGPVLEGLIGGVFDSIANSLVDSFARRAQALYR